LYLNIIFSLFVLSFISNKNGGKSCSCFEIFSEIALLGIVIGVDTGSTFSQVILSSSEGVLEIVGGEGLGVVEVLDLIGLVVLGIVPGVISLIIWGDVGVGIGNLVVLVDGGLIPSITFLLPWLVIPFELDH